MDPLENLINKITKDIHELEASGELDHRDPHDDPDVICLGNGVHLSASDIREVDENDLRAVAESIVDTLCASLEASNTMPGEVARPILLDFVNLDDVERILRRDLENRQRPGGGSAFDALTEADINDLAIGARALSKMAVSMAITINGVLVKLAQPEVIEIHMSEGMPPSFEHILAMGFEQVSTVMLTVAQIHSALAVAGLVENTSIYDDDDENSLFNRIKRRVEESRDEQEGHPDS